MSILSVIELSQLVNLNRQAIYKAISQKHLTKRSDGKIDTTDRINAAWISAREEPKPKIKPCKPQKKKFTEPDFQDVPPGDLPLDTEPDDDPEDITGLEDLIEAEKKANIRLKHSQADRHVQALAERMGLLIPRELVEQQFARVGVEIKNRLIIGPKVWAPRVYSMIKAGSTEAEIRTWLEDEITASLASVKRTLEKET